MSPFYFEEVKMAYTSIENIALVLIALTIIKVFVLLVKPQAWMSFAKGIYSKPQAVKFFGFILAVIVFYYLHYVNGITVIQILAVTTFVALMFMIGLASEVDPLIKKYQARIKKGTMWKDFWFYTLLWLVLIGWGVKELFF